MLMISITMTMKYLLLKTNPIQDQFTNHILFQIFGLVNNQKHNGYDTVPCSSPSAPFLILPKAEKASAKDLQTP